MGFILQWDTLSKMLLRDLEHRLEQGRIQKASSRRWEESAAEVTEERCIAGGTGSSLWLSAQVDSPRACAKEYKVSGMAVITSAFFPYDGYY